MAQQKSFGVRVFSEYLCIEMTEAKTKAKAVREETAEEEGVEEDAPFHMIDDLQSNGVNVGDINKLKAAGCYTIESIFMRTKKDLEQVKGLSEAKVFFILLALHPLCWRRADYLIHFYRFSLLALSSFILSSLVVIVMVVVMVVVL